MNLLDEQIRQDQRELLRRWRIPHRQIGQQERQRHRQNEGDQLLAKGLLAARGGEQAVPGIDGGAQQSFHGCIR